MSRISTFQVLKGFVQGVTGAVIGAVSYPVGTLPVNRHLPGALLDTYRVIYQTNAIGPNLKAVAYVTVPVGGVVVPLLVLTGTTLYGFVRTALSGAQITRDMSDKIFFSRVFGTIRDDLKTIDKKLVENLLPHLRDYQPSPLAEGEKPFDISPFKAVKGVLCGLALTLVEGPSLFLITLLRLPRIAFSLLRTIFESVDDFATFVLSLLLTFLLIGVLALLPPLVMLSTMCFGLGAGCVRGYSEGIRSAVSELFNDLKSWDEVLKSFKS